MVFWAAIPRAHRQNNLHKMTDLLPTGIWINAVMRQLSGRGIGAYVRQRGDADRGTLIVRVDCLNGTNRIFAQHRDIDGKMAWMVATKEDPCDNQTAENYLVRTIQRDPDLWVIEIEDRLGHNPFADVFS